MSVVLDGILMINLVWTTAVFCVGSRMYVLPNVGTLKLPEPEGGTRP